MIRTVSAFCLDVHARYRCQHSGACCESWTVPAEAATVEIVRGLAVKRHGAEGPLFVSSVDAAGAESWTVARDRAGDCVFFDRREGGSCVIHRDVGIEALPSACRHFPRKVLHDARGTRISLSHFCPTAAAMLLNHADLSIVEALPPLRLESVMEGFDAADALPPLIRPGLLSDIVAYDAWERAGIAIFAASPFGYGACLERLSAATESVRQWNPTQGSLLECVHSAFDANTGHRIEGFSQWSAIERVARLTAGLAGDDLSPVEGFEDAWARAIVGSNVEWFERGMKHYLAARLFGNWLAYQSQGLRSVVMWLRACAAVLRHFLVRRVVGSGLPATRQDFIEAVRAADLLLLHVLDTGSFARDVAALEKRA
jgi:Fe-S-cluster containining protein